MPTTTRSCPAHAASRSARACLRPALPAPGTAPAAGGDVRTGQFSIYAQRGNAAGGPQWAANGVAAFVGAGNDANDVVLLWFDERGADADIYAQRLTLAGAAQWGVGGTALCAAAGHQTGGVVVPMAGAVRSLPGTTSDPGARTSMLGA